MFKKISGVFRLGAIALLAAVFSVSPEAKSMILERGGSEVWITDVQYSCIRGNPFFIVKNGAPDVGEGYSVSESEGLKVHIPDKMRFEDGAAKIVKFPLRTGGHEVGVGNVLK
jgi:hypothetical protein